MVKVTLRQQLGDSFPRDFALRLAWVRFIQVLRANKRATGTTATLSSRSAVERALDTEIPLQSARVQQLKESLRSLVRELGERDLSDEQLRGVAVSIDELIRDLLPRVVTQPVALQVSGWPDGFPCEDRERMLRRPLDSLGAVPAGEAAVLGGCRLDVRAVLLEGEQLPAVPRNLRAKPMLRGRRTAWLPHLDEEGRRSLTERSRAEEHARIIEADVVIDACCGCGGNSIAFALAGKQVVALERDAERLELARRNAEAFGVSERIHFQRGELQDHLAPLIAEYPSSAVFMDPPWRSGESIDEVPCWPDLLPGGQDTAGLLMDASFLLLKLPRSFDLATLPRRSWELRWGFGPGAQDSAVVMITCWSKNPSLHS